MIAQLNTREQQNRVTRYLTVAHDSLACIAVSLQIDFFFLHQGSEVREMVFDICTENTFQEERDG